MSPATHLLLLLCIIDPPSTPTVTISFLSGPPLKAVQLLDHRGDSILAGADQWIHLNRIVRIEVQDPNAHRPELGRALMVGAGIGAVIGAAVGSMIERRTPQMFEPSSMWPEAFAIGGAVGVFGGVAWAASEPPGTVYELAGLTLADRRTVVRAIIARYRTESP